ncbi:MULTISPECIES: ATP-binding protein [unclassified Variovorax]|uniref:sensor histidine kinase n=1 Tax=unclassified Variovorax TaxID=663243 RepID=UPI002575142C|nr:MULTISPECIES: ATP-binding protein [unclassified Variovorax]MDM0089434.1 histidine kinase [Variovorax sp. J22G40]MDM0147506.1 histidine kinase [Variovorax sp. J2P1-31]
MRSPLRSRLTRAWAWLAARIGLCLVLVLAAGTALAQPVPELRAEAVRATSWDDTAPPAEGWVPVTLPDSWGQRWPGFDGVVWYRLTWEQPAPVRDTGLLLHYLNMAGEVSLNGTPISRDPSLVEPLTRAWNTPRYWLLAPPLLRPGSNTLLVRVSGLSAYQAGLGPVDLGPPSALQAAFEHERIVRRDLQVLGLALSAAVSAFFAAAWLLRRRETAYGWFALMSVLWLLFGYNQIATSPWPFADNHGWQALNTSLLLLFDVAYLVFALRFCQARKSRLEAFALLVAAAGVLDLWLASGAGLPAHRAAWTLVGGLTAIAVNCGAIVHALRHRGSPMRSLAPFMAVSAAAAGHDLLVFTQVIDSNTYYTTMSSYVLLLGMAMTQAARFVQSLDRIEHFNTELIEEVNAAKSELAATLAQQHALALAHARIGERVNLVSDLHDGLGGMLLGSIATLERRPEALSAPQLLAMLKSLRDDLRLIIEATGQSEGPLAFGELLAPLRHRISQSLDASGIDCRWRVAGLETLELSPSQSLELLRFLQEALTNVLKHSASRRVDVRVQCADGALQLSVCDDGRGFVVEAAAKGQGAGLRSLHARARRLKAELRLESRPGETQVVLRMPLGPLGPVG